MAYLTLRTEDHTQIRFLVSARISEDEFSDEQIGSDVILGVASDHVFESVIDGIDTSVLTGTALTTAEAAKDSTDPDVDTFLTDVLNDTQRKQFRRAVVYRCAALSTMSFREKKNETIGNYTEMLEVEKSVEKQDRLFRRCESEIRNLRDAFPNDAFPSAVNAIPKFKLFALTSTR